MLTVKMSIEQAKLILIFMERANLTGKEVLGYNHAIQPIATAIHLTEGHTKEGDSSEIRPVGENNGDVERSSGN